MIDSNRNSSSNHRSKQLKFSSEAIGLSYVIQLFSSNAENHAVDMQYKSVQDNKYIPTDKKHKFMMYADRGQQNSHHLLGDTSNDQEHELPI